MMSEELKKLHTAMVLSKAEYEAAEDAYDEANIKASPFVVGGRVIYQKDEYQIDRVNSMSHGATSCLAFPIKKDGSVSVRNSVAIYSDVSSFKIEDAKETEQEYRSAVADALVSGGWS